LVIGAAVKKAPVTRPVPRCSTANSSLLASGEEAALLARLAQMSSMRGPNSRACGSP
jgi:hypothetical protein